MLEGKDLAANGNPETAFEVSDCAVNATLPRVSVEIRRDLWGGEGARLSEAFLIIHRLKLRSPSG